MDNQTLNDAAINELLKSFNYMIKNAIKHTTKIYSGLIVSNNNDGKWNVQYNGEIHAIQPHSLANPSVGQIVQVFIPQGNQSIAFFL